MSTRLIASDESEATQEIAEALQLPLGTQLVRLKTVGSADSQPVSVATSYFDKSRFPDMAELVGRHRSVTKAFAAQGLDDYVRISTEVTGRLASAEEASYLGFSASAVVLEAVSVNCDLAGVPVQYARAVFAADRISLKLDTGGT